MRLAELDTAAVAARLRGDGLVIDFGLARARVRSELDTIAPMLQKTYGAFPASEPEGFDDMSVALVRPRGLRGYFQRQIEFLCDGVLPFEPFPEDTPLPLLEWGMNWCVAQRRNHHLLLHAGTVEKDGVAVILPAVPGAGKSTLVAAMMHRGYRLLSDEFGAVDLVTHRIVPSVRPIALKNESVDVIRGFAATAVIGPIFPKTRKGDVGHCAPTAPSVDARTVTAAAGLVLFPKFELGASTEFEPTPKARACAKMSANSFNYPILGPDAFRAVTSIIRSSRCYRLRYSDLNSAIAGIDAEIAAIAAERRTALSRGDSKSR